MKSDINSGVITVKNLRKFTLNNPKLDLVSINAYAKLGQIQSMHSQDTEQKLNRNHRMMEWQNHGQPENSIQPYYPNTLYAQVINSKEINKEWTFDSVLFLPYGRQTVKGTVFHLYLSDIIRKPVFAICKQQMCRSACAFAQSDLHHCYLLLR